MCAILTLARWLSLIRAMSLRIVSVRRHEKWLKKQQNDWYCKKIRIVCARVCASVCKYVCMCVCVRLTIVISRMYDNLFNRYILMFFCVCPEVMLTNPHIEVIQVAENNTTNTQIYYKHQDYE